MHRLRLLWLVAPITVGACSFINAPAEIDTGTTTTGGGGTGASGGSGGTTGGGGTTTTAGGSTTSTSTTMMDVCGDGSASSGEACDDGNTAAGDGCDGTCKVEAGYSCTHDLGKKSTCTCTLLCGNGTLDPGEECDDMGVADMEPPAGNQDYCTKDCKFQEFDIESGADMSVVNELPAAVLRQENGVNTFLVLWHTTPLKRVLGRQYNFDGSYTKGTGSINYATSSAPDPGGEDACTATSNRTVITWHDSADNQIYGRKIESTGMLSDAVATAIPGANPRPSCAFDPMSSTFIVANVGQIPGNPLMDVLVQPFTSFAAPAGGAVDVGDTLKPNPTASWSLSKGFMVSWIPDPAAGGAIAAQQLDPSGKLVAGAFFTMTDAADTAPKEPAGAWLGPQDQFAFVYTRDSVADPMGNTHREVMLRMFNSPGNPSGTTPVATDTNPASQPHIAVNPKNGNFVVVWTDTNPMPNSLENVYYRAFKPDGKAMGEQVAVNENLIGKQTAATAVVDPATGNVAVIWDNFVPNSTKPHKVSAKIFAGLLK